MKAEAEKLNAELLHENSALNQIRLTLHNRVIQLTGNIRVFVRVRPVIESDASDLTKQTIVITEPDQDRKGLKPCTKTCKYGFDRVYNPANTQDDIWDGVNPLVQSCIDGFHVCIFAYGQTGSGKTFTMIGDSKNPGLIPRSIKMLFDTKDDIEKKCKVHGQDVNVTIRVELLEIYNEEVRDLLSPDAGTNGKLVKVDLIGNKAIGNVVAPASSQKDVEDFLKLAQSRRCVKATKSNAKSSRSHLHFTIHFQVASSTNEDLNRNGCLHIIDLAGSERVGKSGSQGDVRDEGKHINKSLTALARVIEKLQAKSEHVPFRDSKLTHLLQNSLGGDSKTLVIVCCSPHREHLRESRSALGFAVNASKVELKKTNTVEFKKVNEVDV
ncbi:hypothetical protein ACHAW6_002622 [Cyclotella cf. meneghiniana]